MYGVLLIIVNDNVVDFRFARLTSGLIDIETDLEGKDNVFVSEHVIAA